MPRKTKIAGSPRSCKFPDFESDATQVVASLKVAIGDVLDQLGGVKRPTDLKNQLDLNYTHSWQLVTLVEDRKGTLGGAQNVPSRATITRFAQAAEKQGVTAKQTQHLLQAYDAFEEVVTRHAGDRGSFNSMISAASMDDDWHVTDLQHRRNVFRGISHMTGLRALAIVKTVICTQGAKPGLWNSIMLSGLSDLRLLWKKPAVTVYQSRYSSKKLGAKARQGVTRSPLFSDRGLDGHLLREFCTGPEPKVQIIEGENGWIYGELLDAPVGIYGESTLAFGSLCSGVPSPVETIGYVAAEAFTLVPSEHMVLDVLIQPGLVEGWKPSSVARVGVSQTDVPTPPGQLFVLPSRTEMSRLGTGPVMIKEFPQYRQMVIAAAAQQGWPIQEYESWRVRMEFPLYHSNIRFQLTSPELDAKT